MPNNLLLLDWDLSKVIQYTPKHLKIPPIPVKIFIEFSNEDEQAVKSDPLLHQRIVDACQPILRTAATSIGSQIRNEDMLLAAIRHASDRGARALVVQSSRVPDIVKQALNNVEQRAGNAANQVIRSLQAEARQYKKYKREVTIKLVLGAAGLGTAALGLVTAVPSGGASLGLAIVGAWRALLDGAKALLNTMKEAEDIGRRVNKKLATLKQRYNDKTRGSVASREMVSSALNALFQTELSNISTAKSDCVLWKNKLTGIRTQSHKLSIDLNQLLLKTEHLKKEEWDNIAARTGGFRKNPFEKMRQNIIEMLTKIPQLYQRAEKGFSAQAAADSTLKAIEKKSPAWTQEFDKWFAFAVNLGLAAAGGADGWSKINDAGLADWIDTAGSTLVDCASLVDEAREEGSGRWKVMGPEK